MTEQEAFEAWVDAPHSDGIGLRDAWHAALAWLRSQGEPVAWIGEGLQPLIPEDLARLRRREPGTSTLYDTPLYAAPQPAIPDGFVIVPKEPTPEMLNAAGPRPAKWNATPAGRMLREEGDKIRCEEWAQMIAAAPQPGEPT